MSAASQAKAMLDHLFRAAMSREHSRCGGGRTCMWCMDEAGRTSLRLEGFDPDQPSTPDPYTLKTAVALRRVGS